MYQASSRCRSLQLGIGGNDLSIINVYSVSIILNCLRIRYKKLQNYCRKIIKMNIWLLSLALASCVFVTVNGNAVVKEISVGRLVELPCLSNDDNHRFMFWQMSDEKSVVGPGNPVDTHKYNYDVLTGKLTIRSASTAESGFYKCISRGLLDNSAINIRAVELVVRKDWEEAWENDFETNLLRSLAAVMVIVVTIAVVLYIMTSKRPRNTRYFDIDDSRENSPSTYRDVPTTSSRVVRTDSSPIVEIGIDNEAVDVDFPKVFTQMHQEQSRPLI